MTPSTPAAVDVEAIRQSQIHLEEIAAMSMSASSTALSGALRHANSNVAKLLSLLPGVGKQDAVGWRDVVLHIAGLLDFREPLEGMDFSTAQTSSGGLEENFTLAVSTIKADLAAAQGRVEGMQSALTQAAERFREYERLHAAKPDLVKAARNGEMAAMCEHALSTTAPAVTGEQIDAIIWPYLTQTQITLGHNKHIVDALISAGVVNVAG